MPRKAKPDATSPRPQREHPRFPTPGPRPRWAPSNEAEGVQFKEELYQWTMRDVIYRAVHTNDPEARRSLANAVGHHVLWSWDLTPDSRKWICWVLQTLVARDQVPHLARGNAVKTDSRREQILQLRNLMLYLPPKPITARLKIAADVLHISYGKARLLYYSDDYQSLPGVRDSKKSRRK